MLSLNLNLNLLHIITIIIIIIIVIIVIMILWRVPRGTSNDGLYGEVPPEKGYPRPPPPPTSSSGEEFITKFMSLLIPYTCNMNYWAFIISEFFMVFGWGMKIFRRKSVDDGVISVFFFVLFFFQAQSFMSNPSVQQM